MKARDFAVVERVSVGGGAHMAIAKTRPKTSDVTVNIKKE